jgi:DDE superfamily endonuclease/Helix-turn-helix of DDE superfamily endonuclease
LVTYRATLDLPGELVSFVENVIATRRGELRSPWRVLTSFDQAVLALVWLRDGDSFEQLGRHFGISTDTAWRYATETMRALAAHAPTLAEALREAGPERRMILDGTLIPTWRCATRPAGHDGGNQDPYYSGKHHRPGLNAQALMGMDGEPAFVGQARCGSTHDLTAAREDSIIDTAAEAGVEILADSGYQGAGGTVRTPVKRPKRLGHNGHEKRANALHAAERAPGERGFALLKGWRVLRLVRISPSRATDLLQAVLVLNKQRSSLARA